MEVFILPLMGFQSVFSVDLEPIPQLWVLQALIRAFLVHQDSTLQRALQLITQFVQSVLLEHTQQLLALALIWIVFCVQQALIPAVWVNLKPPLAFRFVRSDVQCPEPRLPVQ